jgi:hypothetical protein
MYFIYFIKVAENIKIGRCEATKSRLTARLKEAKRWYPDAYVVCLFVVNNKSLETIFHALFSDLNISNEVFKIDSNMEKIIRVESHWCRNRKMFFAKEWNMYLSAIRFIYSYLSSQNLPITLKNIPFSESISWEDFIDDFLCKYKTKPFLIYDLEYMLGWFTVRQDNRMIKLIKGIIAEQERTDEYEDERDDDFTGIGDDGFYYVDGEFCITDPFGIESY